MACLYSISCAPNAKNRSWATDIMKKKDWLIVKPIITSFSATFASSVIKLLEEMVSHFVLFAS